MQYRSPALCIAFALAVVSGALLAIGHYVGAAVTGSLAVVLLALRQWAIQHPDDDRHTLL